jgi:hypothetical protein
MSRTIKVLGFSAVSFCIVGLLSAMSGAASTSKAYNVNYADDKQEWEKARETALNICYESEDTYDCWADQYPGASIHWIDNRSYKQGEMNFVTGEVIANPEPSFSCSNGETFSTAEERDNCEKRISWEKTRDAALKECNADPNKTNCYYDSYPGTTLHWTWKNRTTPQPQTPSTPKYKSNYETPSSPQFRSGAICRDGTISHATGRGACSHHGGVAQWY